MNPDNPDCANKTDSVKSTQRRTALKLAAATIALPAIVVSGGCGQKGPLYIPESDAEREKKKTSS